MLKWKHVHHSEDFEKQTQCENTYVQSNRQNVQIQQDMEKIENKSKE